MAINFLNLLEAAGVLVPPLGLVQNVGRAVSTRQAYPQNEILKQNENAVINTIENQGNNLDRWGARRTAGEYYDKAGQLVQDQANREMQQANEGQGIVNQAAIQALLSSIMAASPQIGQGISKSKILMSDKVMGEKALPWIIQWLRGKPNG